MLELKLDEVTKKYKDNIAVNHISAAFTHGVYGLLGANGAGKTTLLRLLCDILRPDEGKILCNGRPIDKLGAGYRRYMGYLPQDFGFYPDFTAERFLMYMAALKALSVSEAKRKTQELLAMVGLEENSKKTRVREMFDSIAPRYDLLNHLLSFGVDRRWRRRMVGVVAAGTPAAILDVAAGTGDVAVALARRLPAARITGIDLSGEMLAVGRGKVARRGLCDRIELVQGDAEQLPFPDGTFDAVTIGFGIRNFGSIEAGLAEAFRVLRPGGRLCILEFSTPRGRCFGPLYRFYFHRILPLVGRLISKDDSAYTYLPESVDHFPDNLLFLRLMGQAGFAACRSRRQMRGIAYIYEGRKE